MRASTDTLLSLFEWGQLMGINPWELAQIGVGFPEENYAQCEHVFFQHQWQQDFLSREEVANAINKAEDAVASELGYWPAPQYLTEITDWQRGYVHTGYGRVIGGGKRAYTLIEAEAAVTKLDLDGDGVQEKFTVSFATDLTDPAEIGLYVPESARLSEPLDETWRIRPVTVEIADGIATVSGHSSLLVLPRHVERTDPMVLDVNASIYLTELAAYRVYRDTAHGYAAWTATDGCRVPPFTTETREIQLVGQYSAYGLLPVYYSRTADCLTWRQPEAVYLNYLAGVPRDPITGRMAREYADIVAHLAAAWLPVQKCGCERSNRILHWWRALPNDETDEKGRPIAFDEINTPFGERRGAIYAWKRVVRLRSARMSAVQV